MFLLKWPSKILNAIEKYKDPELSEWMSLTPIQQFFSYIMARISSFSMRWWWGPLCTWPTRWIELLYRASTLKQQSANRHVAPLGHIILIPNQPVFSLSPYCCALSGESITTNCIFFGFTRPGFEPTIYCTPGEHTNNSATGTVMQYWNVIDLKRFNKENVCPLLYY
jgi:hypothetical protein